MAVGTAIAAVAGIGMAIYGAVKSSNDKKDAEAVAKSASASFGNIKEDNKMAALQAYDIKGLSDDVNMQAREDAVENIIETTDSGPEAIAGIVGVDKNTRAANIKAGVDQGKVNAETQATILGADQDIETARVLREKELALSELKGAQTATAAADDEINRNIGAGFSSAGDLAGVIGNHYGDGGEDTLPPDKEDLG